MNTWKMNEDRPTKNYKHAFYQNEEKKIGKVVYNLRSRIQKRNNSTCFRRTKISENQVTGGGEYNLILEKKMKEFWKIIIEVSDLNVIPSWRETNKTFFSCSLKN